LLDLLEEETHVMRFFFPKEFDFMLTKAGFDDVGMHASVKLAGTPTVKDWNMVRCSEKTLGVIC
jgi:hypothetical protein